jgi:hypothetical protein
MSPLLANLVDHRSTPMYPNYTLSSPRPQPVDMPMHGSIPLNESRRMYPLLVETASWINNNERSEYGVQNGLESSLCAIRRFINRTTDLTGYGAKFPMDSGDPDNTKTSTSMYQHAQGWRWSWIVNRLIPEGTNYTAWVVEDDSNFGRGTLYGPIFMLTKEG